MNTGSLNMLAGSFLQEPGLVLTCTSAVLLLLPLLHTVVYSGFGRDKHLFTLSIQQGLVLNQIMLCRTKMNSCSGTAPVRCCSSISALHMQVPSLPETHRKSVGNQTDWRSSSPVLCSSDGDQACAHDADRLSYYPLGVMTDQQD